MSPFQFAYLLECLPIYLNLKGTTHAKINFLVIAQNRKIFILKMSRSKDIDKVSQFSAFNLASTCTLSHRYP